MKLKTLKDIEIGCKHCLGAWVSSEKLKQEAIKWVKKHSAKEKDCCWNKPISECWGMGKDWIDFFNITEEDLK